MFGSGSEDKRRLVAALNDALTELKQPGITEERRTQLRLFMDDMLDEYLTFCT